MYYVTKLKKCQRFQKCFTKLESAVAKTISQVFLKCLLLWTNAQSVTILMKAAERCFAVLLFIVIYKLFLTFQSVDKILK